MTVYAPVAPTLAGVASTIHAAASGDQISAVNKLLLVVTNGSGAAITLTLEDQGTSLPEGAPASSTFADVTNSVAAGATEVQLVRDTSRFRDSSGLINLTWSATATVTWQAIEVQ